MGVEFMAHVTAPILTWNQLIALAKKGIVSKEDRELIEYFEKEVNSNTFKRYTADYNEIDLDDIPF